MIDGTSTAAQRRPGSLGLALACGLGAAIVGAVVWGLLTYLTKHQYSIVAMLVGLGVGYAVCRVRPGDTSAAIGGGILALLGGVLGSFLGLVFFLLGDGASLGQVLGHLGLVMTAFRKSIGFLGVAFWLLAGFFGFRIPLQGGYRRLGTRRPRARMSGQSAGVGGQATFGQGHESGQPTFGQPSFGQPAASEQPPFGQTEPGSGQST